MRTLLLATLILGLALAGCSGKNDVSNGPDGQTVAGGGSLTYNGASNGSHTDDVESDGSCSLHLTANVGMGKVKVTLTTLEGTTVDQTVSGPGQFDGTVGDASGKAGTWTLKAERSGDTYGSFSGQYTARAVC
ncbi:MAG: hypothetical protein QOC71_715 [Thermoplasmata archaeon]|jgi:hypothetical protein|nr:hypothetical protein [Thermoplasmata archaeon]